MVLIICMNNNGYPASKIVTSTGRGICISWSEMNCSIMELALYMIRNIHVDCGLPLMSPYRNSETVQIISPKQCMTIERQFPTMLH